MLYPWLYEVLAQMLSLRPMMLIFQFARINASSLIYTEKILNRPITKFYNSDDVNVIATELRLTKTRSTSFYKKHNILQRTMPTHVDKGLKTKC